MTIFRPTAQQTPKRGRVRHDMTSSAVADPPGPSPLLGLVFGWVPPPTMNFRLVFFLFCFFSGEGTRAPRAAGRYRTCGCVCLGLVVWAVGGPVDCV